MVRLLIYGYTTGVRSSRAIQRKCADDIAFRFLAADRAPDFRSIARFRRHLNALAGLFTQSLHLAIKLGMVKTGRVALDGTQRGSRGRRSRRTNTDSRTASRGRTPPEVRTSGYAFSSDR